MMTPAGMTTPAPMHWLSRLEGTASVSAQGHGLLIAVVLAVISVVIAIPVALNWRPTPFLVLGIALGLVYWIVGQGFGGMFYTPSATDPNSGPLLVLFALVLYTLTPVPARAPLGQLAPGVAGRWRRPSGRPDGAASVLARRCCSPPWPPPGSSPWRSPCSWTGRRNRPFSPRPR